MWIEVKVHSDLDAGELLSVLDDPAACGERILDVGAGRGLLAMVALRLGATSAVGIDCDAVAIACAREYAAANGFGHELTLETASIDRWDRVPPRSFEVILANLDRATILGAVSRFGPYLEQGGRLLISGILVEDEEEITAAFARRAGRVDPCGRREGWSALEVRFPESCEA